MNLPDAPIAHEGFFTAHTVEHQSTWPVTIASCRES